MLIDFEPVKVSFDDLCKVHAVFYLQKKQAIGLAEKFIERADKFSYEDEKRNYEQAVEMLGLHMFDSFTWRDEELKEKFPEWEAPDIDEPLFMDDWESIQYEATGTEEDVPF